MPAPGAWSTPEGAASWQASLAQRQQSMAATTELLFDRVGLGPGMRVLEIGSAAGIRLGGLAVVGDPQNLIVAHARSRFPRHRARPLAFKPLVSVLV